MVGLDRPIAEPYGLSSCNGSQAINKADKGQVWAEPDIDHAISHMLKLNDNRDYGRELGRTASQHMRTYFSYRAVGLKYKNRIEEILDENSLSETQDQSIGKMSNASRKDATNSV